MNIDHCCTKTCSRGHEMVNLGNISGIVFVSNPEQWDEVWVCHLCKEKKTFRIYGDYKVDWNSAIKDYKEKPTPTQQENNK